MSKRYRPQKLKFSGEEAFIVNDGSDKKFLMMVATDVPAQISPDVIVPTTTTVSGASETPVVLEPTPVVLTFPNWDSLSCSQLAAEIENLQNILATSRFDEGIRAQYEAQINLGKSLQASKCNRIETPVELPPAPPVLSEPVWSSLSCGQVKEAIASFELQLENTSFAEETKASYKTYIENGKKYYDTRCNISTGGGAVSDTQNGVNTSTTTITTSGTPIIATAGSGLVGGGIRGGGGGAAGGETPVTEKKKSQFNWWWIVAAGVGLYLITKKKK